MRSIFFLLMVFMALSGWGQTNREWITKEIEAKRQDQNNPTAVQGGISGGLQWDLRYEGVKGSPLLLDEWLGGAILFTNGNLYPTTGETINLDVVEGKVLIKYTTENTMSFPCKDIKEVYLENEDELDIYLVLNQKMLGAKKDKFIFLKELGSGDYNLYKENKKSFIEANYEGGYSPDRRYDEFRDEYRYYMQGPDKEYVEVKPKSKSLEKAFPKHAKAIKTEVKKSNLDLKSDKDFAILIHKVFNS